MKARGARIHGEVAGEGMTTDAYHVTSTRIPRARGWSAPWISRWPGPASPRADVGYVNAHGTGTLQNDRIEALALARVFGERGVLVSSSKSLVGHTMAAAGSLEAAATLLALQHGLLPPTANLEDSDPEVPFDCVPKVARPAAVECAVTNSFGFGGQNVSLVLRRFAADERAASRRRHRPRHGERGGGRRRRRPGRGAPLAARPSPRSAPSTWTARPAGWPPRWTRPTLADLIDRDAARRLSRICRLAVAASRQAVADARLDPAARGRLAIVMGTEHGDFRSSEEFAAGFLRRGVGGLSPMIFPNTVMNSMAAVAAIAVGARGPTITVNQATVAGDLAVARGARLVASGQADAVLAGGVDEICALGVPAARGDARPLADGPPDARGLPALRRRITTGP